MRDIYYETPRLPMFLLMEEDELVRVRALKYVDGELQGVLADWDVGILQDKFYEKEHFNSEYERPFYCLHKDKDGDILFWDNEKLMEFAKNEAELWGEAYYTAQEIYDNIVGKAKMLGCPIFDSIEEARKYVFDNPFVR